MKKYTYHIILALIIFFSSCGEEKKTADTASDLPDDNQQIEVTQEQFKAMKMEITALQEREFDTTIKASGKVDVPPKNRAKVSSFVAGHVKSISLLVGSKVTKGQALLTLESPEYIDLQQSYMEIAAQMEFLKSENERQKTLFDEKISSQKKYLEAESNYKRARATYESLRQKLNVLHINPTQVEGGQFSSSITVYSPITGDITAIYANVGMAISPTDIILEIVDTQAMHLELAVFEKDIFNLKNGQNIRFTIPQVGTNELKAKVSQIGKSVEGSDRVVNVYASLSNEIKHNLLIGMFVEAQLVASFRKALSVPFDAVAEKDEGDFILILESEKDGIYTFRKTLVEMGERNGEWLEIRPVENLNTNAKILSKGVYDVM